MKVKQKAVDLDQFVQALLTDKIKAGEVIRQSELCEVLGTSLSPLRELLVLLEELDLVEVKPKAGFRIIYPDINFMRENMQFRIMIESEAIGYFIETATDEWIEDQIEQHQAKKSLIENAEDHTAHSPDLIEFDREFHGAIVASINNSTMAKAHRYTHTKLRIGQQVHGGLPPRKAYISAMQQHLKILAALQTRDLTSVKTALDEHFTSLARAYLLGH